MLSEGLLYLWSWQFICTVQCCYQDHILTRNYTFSQRTKYVILALIWFCYNCSEKMTPFHITMLVSKDNALFWYTKEVFSSPKGVRQTEILIWSFYIVTYLKIFIYEYIYIYLLNEIRKNRIVEVKWTAGSTQTSDALS